MNFFFLQVLYQKFESKVIYYYRETQVPSQADFNMMLVVFPCENENWNVKV